jgi:succinate dehydrogenase/fumarate reductase flavoprotein subunit
MVFGARLAEAIESGADGPSPTGAMRAVLHDDGDDGDRLDGVNAISPGRLDKGRPAEAGIDVGKELDRLQRAMFDGAGVVRDAESLDLAADTVDAVAASVGDGVPTDRAHGELANLATAARALLASATVRTESRGAHARADFPLISDQWRRRILHTGGEVVVSRQPVDAP